MQPLYKDQYGILELIAKQSFDQSIEPEYPPTHGRSGRSRLSALKQGYQRLWHVLKKTIHRVPKENGLHALKDKDREITVERHHTKIET